MKIFKTTLTLLVLCVSFHTNVYASTVKSTTINEFSNNTTVDGSLPNVTTDSASLTKLVNSEITNIYNTRSTNAKNSNAKKITFSYDTYESNNVTSIVIYSSVSKLKSVDYINTIVYDDSKIYTLDTYLSSSDLKVFNKNINDTIKKSPQNYKVSDVTLNDKTSFYVKNGVTYAAFDGESLSSSPDVKTFSFSKSNVDTYTLKKDKYYVQDSTQIKYVPIREVYNGLGYKVSYRNKFIYVYDVAGKKIATFDTDQQTTSSYSNANAPLNYKAFINDDVAYTPLSVVKSTTGIVYDIKSNGDIALYYN